jgi:hypothetical protein
MDEDVKTLMAIVALVYGSSNGLGLLKTALDPVETKTKELKAARDALADASYINNRADELTKSLWTPSVLVYVTLVIILPLFLGLVLWRGPSQALAWIGLGGSAVAAQGSRGLTFYWILLLFSLVASVHHLSLYFKGWRALIRHWESEQNS